MAYADKIRQARRLTEAIGEERRRLGAHLLPFALTAARASPSNPATQDEDVLPESLMIAERYEVLGKGCRVHSGTDAIVHRFLRRGGPASRGTSVRLPLPVLAVHA